ncbi:hypothetical protein C8R44DRAFT_632024 [Mycena epipterygia]|nr:hypothetical protein C8R44DRAFT_632024 [Mycena epipterygia]
MQQPFPLVSVIPPLIARLGQACYKCFKSDHSLFRRCSGCHRVAYCSTGCQNADWREHKAICQALKNVENPQTVPVLLSITDVPTTDLDDLDLKAEVHDLLIARVCESALGRYAQLTILVCSATDANVKRSLTVPERNLIATEPRCGACARTDQVLRIETTRNPDAGERRQLSPCPECNFVFYCSPAHRDVACVRHHAPCEDGHDGLSQCELNKEVDADSKFEIGFVAANGVPFSVTPGAVRPAWTSLQGTTWEREFAAELRNIIPASLPLEPRLRSASNQLNMPITILYALEHLNDTDGWTRQETLTIHLMGAADLEVQCIPLFEEIMHRVPGVKTLKIVLCGPELDYDASMDNIRSLTMCSDCTRRGRVVVQQSVQNAYHAFVAASGSKFNIPDLAIAFNSGFSDIGTALWLETARLLIARKIPTVFTSYDRQEAQEEARLLREAGAQLHPALGPCKNLWGSLQLHPQPSKVRGFYSANGWIAGGFR